MPLNFIIEGKIIGLNEYTDACRAHARKGATLKREEQDAISWKILSHRNRSPLPASEYPCKVSFHWIEKNGKRDLDNVCFGQKLILDSLVSLGILKDDGQKYIKQLIHEFSVDPKNPRIEITISPLE